MQATCVWAKVSCRRLINAALTLAFGLSVAAAGAAGLPMDKTQALQMFQALSPSQQAEVLRTLQQATGASASQPALSEPQVVAPLSGPSDATVLPGSQDVETGAGDEPSRAADGGLTSVEQRLNRGTASATLDVQSVPRAVDQRLRQFGYDLFAGVPTTFAPATDIPVPVDYVIGPGDAVQVQLFGNSNAQYSLTVSREGVLSLPDLGPLSVAGMSFAQMKDEINGRIGRQMIGVQASVSMGPLRSIRVFVLGDVNRPGSYTVSALTTVTNALFVSGGIKPIGSLRNIEIKRAGKLIGRLDLYDLLLKGDTSSDMRLQPGDVIFVPPIGPTVGVGGEVRRPAIYELNSKTTAAELVALAGGALPSARVDTAQIERIAAEGGRVLLDVNLARRDGQEQPVHDGDVLRVYSALEKLDNIVLLEGHVQRPGGYQWREGMRLSNLLTGTDSLLPAADVDYVVIARTLQPGGELQVSSAELGAAIAQPGGPADPSLLARDRVIVFGQQTDRATVLAPLLERLRAQARKGAPEQVVTVRGMVAFPGDYPLEQGMTVTDLVRAAGGFAQQAYGSTAELARYELDGDRRSVKLMEIELAAARAGRPEADLPLQPFDVLHVRPLPEWYDKETIELVGEVRFPGTYTIQRGESLKSILKRAGGVTELAYPFGAVYSRQELRDKEARENRALRDRLQADIAAVSLEQLQADPTARQSVSTGQALLAQLEVAEPVGRLVINLPKILAGEEEVDVRGGDRLVIPKRPQEVTVVGEVHQATSHLFDEQLARDDYIELSGGMTSRADDDRIYVVRASGAVIASSRSLWFSQGAQRIEPGDTIVVPLDADRMRPLTLWATIADIAQKLALTAASAKAVGVF